MPILPGDAGNLPRLGFGLWAYPAVSIALELVVAGDDFSWRAAERAVIPRHPEDRGHAYSMTRC